MSGDVLVLRERFKCLIFQTITDQLITASLYRCLVLFEFESDKYATGNYSRYTVLPTKKTYRPLRKKDYYSTYSCQD